MQGFQHVKFSGHRDAVHSRAFGCNSVAKISALACYINNYIGPALCKHMHIYAYLCLCIHYYRCVFWQLQS